MWGGDAAARADAVRWPAAAGRADLDGSWKVLAMWGST